MTQDIAGLCNFLRLHDWDKAATTIERLQKELDAAHENDEYNRKANEKLQAELTASQDRVAKLEEALKDLAHPVPQSSLGNLSIDGLRQAYRDMEKKARNVLEKKS